MKVLHITQPVSAGVWRVAADLMGLQIELGEDVHLASPLTQEPVAAGVTWHRWEATRQPGSRVPGETSRLAHIIDSVRPDLVHLHSAKAGLCGRLAIRGRLATVFQPHGWSFLAVTGTQRRLARRWERVAARWCDALVCVSDGERTVGQANRIIHPRYVTIPNGVNVASFGRQTKVEARRSLGIPLEDSLVVCVSRLAYQKGVDQLLDSWADVVSTSPGSRLSIIGDGEDRRSLDYRARDLPGVTLHGAQTDVAAWYTAADVTVLPSRYEGMALTPLEAMASGRSIVGFDVEGFAEALGEFDGPSPVIEGGDTRALASAISLRLQDAHLREEEGRSNELRAMEHYDISRAAAELAHLYRDLVAEKATSEKGPPISNWPGRSAPRNPAGT